MQIIFVVIVSLLLLNEEDNSVLGLVCLKCKSRVHPGCLNLNMPEIHQECAPGEVCVKQVALMDKPVGSKGQRNKKGKGAIRDCVPLPQDAPLGGCTVSKGSENQIEVKCYCNDTSLCNGSSDKRQHSQTLLPIITAICALFISICALVI